MIVTDVLMPKMGGFQLCRACKSDNKLRKLLFVFYTATYTDKKDKDFALDPGAEKFIVKLLARMCFRRHWRALSKNTRKGVLLP